MEIKKVMVVGAGQMGNGIAQVFAQTGFDTVQYDINMELVEKGIATIDKNLSRGVSKGKMTEDERPSFLAELQNPSVLKMQKTVTWLSRQSLKT